MKECVEKYISGLNYFTISVYCFKINLRVLLFDHQYIQIYIPRAKN